MTVKIRNMTRMWPSTVVSAGPVAGQKGCAGKVRDLHRNVVSRTQDLLHEHARFLCPVWAFAHYRGPRCLAMLLHG